eukprot:TRINITY_DN1229_c0_g1_i1.p1 TRINITY_DN1229_c0_g1~~TRINITY_DN1229_c0_g1_i1.p1  ORF type:complete len:972 (-),score=387.36 TRINITY_DN1229_c0_g1_i1:212-3127(-)
MKDSEKEKLKHFFDAGDPDEIFILEEEIASGSFGAVYKGRHGQTGKYYAVKIITPEEDEVLEDFMVEISVLRKCKNENIVGFFGSWIKGEELFIAMELCDGGAVSDIFQVSNEPLTEDQIALITRETLKGLIYLHQCGIIHRDIKGANILLCNSGDIKLVDFGVSAELRNPGDRRNTLIGTPYWMAPEVISNKTGNVPYDTKADVWSLGITLLELAERNPPLHEIHPMKALMMIPMRDAPTFTHPDQWSREFRDFVAQCLVKAPEKRKSATELLQHPFISNCKPKSVLVDLINRRRKAESRVDDEDDDDSSDDDLDSEDEQDLPTAPVSPPQPLTGSHDIAALDASTPGSSPGGSPWQARRPGTQSGMRSSGSFLMTSTGSTVASDPRTSRDELSLSQSPSSGNVAAATSPKKEPTMTKSAMKTASPGTKRGTSRPGNPNRPTYRTGRNLTRREIKEQQKQIITRQLMKQQLKELRTQQQNHLKEQEKQQRQQQKEHEQLTTKYANLIGNKSRQTAKDLEAMQRRHKTDLENLVKSQIATQKNLQKQHGSTLRNNSKIVDNEAKKIEKDFKEDLKKKTKEQKLILKDKQRSLSKKDYKLLKAEQEYQIGWEDLLFTHKQSRTKQQAEFVKREELQDNQAKYEREQLERRLMMQWDQLEQQQRFMLESTQQIQTMEKEQVTQIQPLEMNHLQDKQQLERQQLVEQQMIETTQQRQLLIGELKSQTREFKKKLEKDQQDLMLQVKVLSKDKSITKKDLKQKEIDLKAALRVQHQKLTQEFEEKQGKQRQEEEEMIRNHQEQKKEQRRQEQEEQLRKLREAHEQDSKRLYEEHQSTERTLLLTQLQERNDLLEEQHNGYRQLQAVYHKQFEELQQDFRNEQLSLITEQHAQEAAYRTKHQRSDEAETQKVVADQEEEKQTLSLKQTADQEIFVKQLEVERQHLESELAKQKKRLIETGRREPIYLGHDGAENGN